MCPFRFKVTLLAATVKHVPEELTSFCSAYVVPELPRVWQAVMPVPLATGAMKIDKT